MDQQRTCKVCGETKPIDDFYLYDKRRGYRSRSCIACESEKRNNLLETERTCKTCGVGKPLSEFNIAQGREGYRRHECKPCESARKKEWYNRNYHQARQRQKEAYEQRKNQPRFHSEERRKYLRELAKRSRAKYKDLAIKHYGGYKCACCGETEPLFLTLDHINNDGYMLRKYGEQPGGAAQIYHWLHKHGYPEGFQVLCMNCNFGKARNGGICPHKKGSTTIP